MKNAEIMPISQGSTYEVYVPSVEFYTERILNGEYFSFTKLSIEWWMLLMKSLRANGLKVPDVMKAGIDDAIIPQLAKGMYDEWNQRQKGRRKYKTDKNVLARILKMSISKKPKEFYLGVTDRCNVKSLTFPLPYRGPSIVNLIQATLPKDEIPVHALPFRIWAVTGAINDLISKIKHKNIVIVGPDHLKDFGYKLGIKNFNFVEIHKSEATLRVQETKDLIKKRHNAFMSGHGDVTYFFIGGGAAMWLITELHGELQNASLIDVGRAFDVYYFYDPVMRKYPNWMFGQWLTRGNTAWVRNTLKPDKNGTYCLR